MCGKVEVLIPSLIRVFFLKSVQPVPVAAWSRVSVCGCSSAEIVGANIAGGGGGGGGCLSVVRVVLLSGSGFCDELIIHPEELRRLCVVVVCDLETSRI